MSTNILVISGRQQAQAIHNDAALAAIKETITDAAASLALSATHTVCHDSDHLLNTLAGAHHYAGIIIDTGTVTYHPTSLIEAITHCAIPCIQVITDHQQQSTPAQNSSATNAPISSACVGVIGGFGVESYQLGLTALNKIIR